MRNLIKILLRSLLFFFAALIILLLIFHKGDTPRVDVIQKYAVSPSKFMPLMGMEVHYRDEGDPQDSFPILLLHGLSSSLYTWDSLTSMLSEKKRVIRIDLPGFGLTGPDPEQAYSIDYYNRFIDSFMIKMNINQYIIAGNSFGGNIAWNQALYRPEKIRKLILINSAGYPRTKEKGNIGFKLAAIPVLGEVIKKVTPRALVKKSLKDAYSDDNKISEAITNRYYDLLLCEGNRQALIDIFKQRAVPNPDNIKNVHAPTLIIWGKDDQMIDVSNGLRFNQDIQGSLIRIIDHSGHVPMEETPRAVYQAMINFVQ